MAAETHAVSCSMSNGFSSTATSSAASLPRAAPSDASAAEQMITGLGRARGTVGGVQLVGLLLRLLEALLRGFRCGLLELLDHGLVLLVRGVDDVLGLGLLVFARIGLPAERVDRRGEARHGRGVLI